MKLILDYLRKYLKDYYQPKLYLVLGLFLAICIFLNFYFDIHRNIALTFRHTWMHWPIMSGLLLFPFLVTCGLIYYMTDHRDWLRSREFWVKVLVGFAIIGFERSFYAHYALYDLMQSADRLFFLRCMGWGRSYLATFIPLLMFYWFYEKQRDPYKSWFGLTLRDTDFRPYFLLVVIVFVGIAIASFLSELNTYYPRYVRSGGARFADAHGFDQWISVLIYEIVYGSYFLNVELFFRGFLVIGFARVLGGHAVLAMVGSYVFLHFGKPISECITSAFGGYLIGILAFYSHRIWGGVLLHVALAWSMELFAWLQNEFL